MPRNDLSGQLDLIETIVVHYVQLSDLNRASQRLLTLTLEFEGTKQEKTS